MIQALTDRVGKLRLDQSEDELVTTLKARGVLTDRRWNFLSWDTIQFTRDGTDLAAALDTEPACVP